MLVILFALFTTSAAPVPPPERLLPADTLGVITLSDFPKARSTFSQWPASQLWKDSAMKPFKDKFIEKFKSDLLRPMEREFGITLSDYVGLAQGQLTWAVTRNDWEGKSDPSPGFLLLMDAKDKSDTLKTTLTELKKKWVDNGKQIKTEKIRDVEFTTLIFSSDDLSKTLDKAFPDPNAGHETLDAPKPKKAARKLQWLVGQSGTLFVLGSSAKDIEKVLILQSGGSVPALADQASFAANHTAHFRDALSYGWVNLKTIVEVLSKKSAKAESQPDQDPPALNSEKLLSALGLTALQSLSFQLRDSAEGCLFDVLLSVPESNRKGIFRILSYEAKEANPPPFVPADAVKFVRWRLDMPKAWATLESTLNDVNPSIGGVIKLVVDTAGKDKDPNFDLRKNLIGNLGDDIISYEKAPRKQTLNDLNSPPSLFLLSSSNADQLAGALKALGSLLSQPSKMKDREFLGRKVYSMSLPAGLGGSGGGKPIDRTLHYAASGGYVALSTDVAMLEEYLRSNQGKALRSLPGLIQAAEKVGGTGTGLFGFENQSETMRATFETLRKESGTLANLFGNSPLAGRLGMSEGQNKFKDWFDFSLLPAYEKVAKYFYITVWSGSVSSEGLRFKVFAPTPPQSKQ